jgi:hypothetical protein
MNAMTLREAIAMFLGRSADTGDWRSAPTSSNLLPTR